MKINFSKIPLLRPPPYRIGLRQQLMILVLTVALCSLITLAVITGVYFTSSYKSLRADRLYVAAQLKSSQMEQSLDYFQYQCSYVSQNTEFGEALVRNKAGNDTNENWAGSTNALDKFLSTSNTFTNAVLYDSTFTEKLTASNNGTGENVPDSVLRQLLPLSGSEPLPSSVNSIGMLTNPVLNHTNYLMSMSFPIFSTASILLVNDELVGYITIVMAADSIRSVFNDSTSLGTSEVSFVSAVYINGTLSGYSFVFPPNGYVIPVNTTFTDLNDTFIGNVFSGQKQSGSIRKTKFFYDTSVALGYSKCSFELTNWIAVVTQPEKVFLAPSSKLTNIITGTVVGLGVAICLITSPLAKWAVQPIVRLKQATETIAAGRGLKSNNHSATDLTSNHDGVISLGHRKASSGSTGTFMYGHKRKSTSHSILSFAKNSFRFGGSFSHGSHSNEGTADHVETEQNAQTNKDTNNGDTNNNDHCDNALNNNDEKSYELNKAIEPSDVSARGSCCEYHSQTQRERGYWNEKNKDFLEPENAGVPEVTPVKKRSSLKDVHLFSPFHHKHHNSNNDDQKSRNKLNLVMKCNTSELNNQGDTNTLHSPAVSTCESALSFANSTPYNDRRPDYVPHASSNLINARIPVYRRVFIDELSELTDTFNTMTDELDRYYSLLEERVRARTKELEHAKIEAESANEAKTVFIANISHELRTPLNGILGMTAIAMAEKDPEQVQNSLKLIFRSGELLLHILTELLTFSKNVLKKTKLEKREFLIQDIALQIKSIFGKLAKDQHVNLTVTISPNQSRKMVLWGDSNRLIQIVMNLVSNSLKFTPVDGKVDVRISLMGKYDYEKSLANNHKKVYVVEEHVQSPLRNSIQANEKSVILKDPFVDKSNSQGEESVSASRSTSNDVDPTDKVTEGKDGVKKTESTATEKKEVDNEHHSDDDLDGDLSSLASSSASSYEDALFLSQFKKSEHANDEFDDYNARMIEEEDRDTWVFCIEVEDTGPGIEPKLQKTVFEPFVQGDQTLSRQYGGTGLGLSICRQLALMMNGTMSLESEVGHGSKFTFVVPLKQTRELLLTEEQNKFNDEFNAFSKTRRKIRFREARKSQSSKPSVLNTDDARSNHSGTSVRTKPIFSKRSSDSSIKTSSAKNLSVKTDRPFLQSTGTATSSQNVPTLSSPSLQKSPISEDEPLTTTHTALSSGGITNSPEKSKAPGATDADGQAQDTNATQTPREKVVRILVAEDNNVNQLVIKRMLNLQGYSNIDLAFDGQDAVDKVRAIMERSENGNEYYDIIFMDVQMPRIDGLEATRIIRNELHYTKNIVALTAFADDSNIKECLESGMNGFLSKPIKRPMLKKILQEYLEKSFDDV
ncbi:hypothetical protein ACO0QE_000082 [Hanseniaspora vineae]